MSALLVSERIALTRILLQAAVYCRIDCCTLTSAVLVTGIECLSYTRPRVTDGGGQEFTRGAVANKLQPELSLAALRVCFLGRQ